MKKLEVVSLVCGCLACGPRASTLGDLTAQMKAGEWRTLATQNIATVLREDGNGASGGCLGYADGAAWDPQGEQLFFMGTDHMYGGSTPTTTFVRYSAAANAWTRMPRPGWFSWGHGYDHNTIDPVNGHFYYRAFDGKSVYRYDIAAGSWTGLPAMNFPQYISAAFGMAYFPQLGGIFVSNMQGGSAHFLNTATRQWSTLAVNLSVGSYGAFAEYNPVHKTVLFGGGNSPGDRILYKADAAGKITALKTSPISLGVQQSLVTVDPVSGDYLVFGSGGSFYVYDITADAWIQQPGSRFFGTTLGGGTAIWQVVAEAVGSYGANIFVKYNGAASNVFLYKHAVSTAISKGASKKPAELVLHPNPATSGQTVRIGAGPHPARITVTDVRGKAVANFSDSGIWETKGLAGGVYILKVDIGKARFTQRMTILF